MGVPRHRLDLLPQYARIAATLSTAAPSVQSSIAFALAEELRAEFRSLCRRKVGLQYSLTERERERERGY
jgi:hypothetical protein